MKLLFRKVPNSNTISILLMFVAVLTTFESCKKEPKYSFQLILENSTNDNFIAKVYPNSTYPISYWRSYAMLVDEELGEVSFKMDTFHREIGLYSCGDPNNLPVELLSEVFDSIILFMVQEEDIVETLKFTPDTAVGYIDNPYTDQEVWIYKYFNVQECTMTCEPVEGDTHTFTIEKSKYR